MKATRSSTRQQHIGLRAQWLSSRAFLIGKLSNYKWSPTYCLLLQSSDQRDEGNLPAKLFEYLYARRPILFIGYERGIAARLVTERNAGLVSNSPVKICDQLQRWLEDKRVGRLERRSSSVSLGLSRDDQYDKLERLFQEVLESRVGTGHRLPLSEARALN